MGVAFCQYLSALIPTNCSEPARAEAHLRFAESL